MPPNLILNHDFATDVSNWIPYNSPTTFEWSAGRAHLVSSGGVRGFQQVSVPVVNGTEYWLVFDYEVVSGEIGYSLSGASGSNITGAGTKLVRFVAGASQTMQFHSDDEAAEFYIDNVFVERYEPMALATSINVTIRDAKNRQSVVSTNVLSTTILSDVVEVAQQFATLLDAVTIGEIIGISIVANAALPGGLDSYDAASDVEEGALFLLDCAGGVNSRMTVPTFDETMILTDSRIVDLTDTDVAALVTFLEDGFTTTEPTLVEPTEYREADIEAVAQAYEVFRKSQGKPT